MISTLPASVVQSLLDCIPPATGFCRIFATELKTEDPIPFLINPQRTSVRVIVVVLRVCATLTGF